MIRRIYAIVSEQDFYKFLTKAKEEGLTMGEALASLVKHYISSDSIKLVTHKDALSKVYKQEHTLADVEVMYE